MSSHESLPAAVNRRLVMDQLPTDLPCCQMRGRSGYILGKFSLGHLGDTLCTSALPRTLRFHLGHEVYIADRPNARAVFTCNPYVAGFVTGDEIEQVEQHQKGEGHVIQRLERGFGLPVSKLPRPEIYLDESEWAWAEAERRKWAPSRPVCLLSCGGITHRKVLQSVDWARVGRILSRHFTVVQAILGETPLPDAITYQDLPTRQYMALIAIADMFVGGNSGGAHIAAAFNIRSLIVSRQRTLRRLCFPAPRRSAEGPFMYPQHGCIAAEAIGRRSFQDQVLEEALAVLAQHSALNARAGRRTMLDTADRRAVEKSPARLPQTICKTGGRIISLRAPIKM